MKIDWNAAPGARLRFPKFENCRRSLGAALSALSVLSGVVRDSAAQSYPQKPVRLVVPAPAGGPTDVPGRLVAEGLSNLIGQRFVVENRVGAGGLIAGE